MVAQEKTGGKPVRPEIFESLDSVRGVLTPLDEARKRELSRVARKAILKINRITHAIGFKTEQTADFPGE
jgi:hypothetical protein